MSAMSCAVCVGYDADERRAIERDALPLHPLGECTCVDTAELAITYLTPKRFHVKPQVGLPISQGWHSLLRWLTWPSQATSKDGLGAWCPAALPGGIIKGGKGPVSLLVADVDDCVEGALDRTAEALASHAGAVIPTFNATPEKPKHRIVLLPTRKLTVEEFRIAWSKMLGFEVSPVIDNSRM